MNEFEIIPANDLLALCAFPSKADEPSDLWIGRVLAIKIPLSSDEYDDHELFIEGNGWTAATEVLATAAPRDIQCAAEHHVSALLERSKLGDCSGITESCWIDSETVDRIIDRS